MFESRKRYIYLKRALEQGRISCVCMNKSLLNEKERSRIRVLCRRYKLIHIQSADTHEVWVDPVKMAQMIIDELSAGEDPTKVLANQYKTERSPENGENQERF